MAEGGSGKKPRGLPDYLDPKFNPYRKASDENTDSKLGFDFKGFMKRPNDMRLPIETLENLAKWKPQYVAKSTKFHLEMADDFSTYLLSVAKGVLTAEDFENDGIRKKWNIYLDDEYLGIYTLYCLSDFSSSPRTYEGKIPFYPYGRRKFEDWEDIRLDFSSDRDGNFRRYDKYTKIPFP